MSLTKLALKYLILLWASLYLSTEGRIFERCEFGFELTDEGIEAKNWTHEISKWSCIANHSSLYDTTFYDESALPLKTYGILKITNTWCDDQNGSENKCGVLCSDLQRDNISDTVACANQVFRDAGNSFVPWYPVWQDICGDSDTTPYILGCERDITFTSLDEIVEVVEGENFTLTCSAKGYPALTLNWQFESEEHITPGPQELVDIDYTMSLNFQPIKFEDVQNSYTCHARNSDTNSSQVFQLRFADGTTSENPDTTESETVPSTIASTTTELDTESSTISTTAFTTTDPSTTEPSEATSTITTVPTTEPTTTSTSGSSTDSTMTTPTSTPNSTRPPTTRTTIDPIAPTPPPGTPKIYEPCELAKRLTYLFNDSYEYHEHLESWLCLSEETADFNCSFLKKSDTNPRLWHYGIFKISNEWCTDGYNVENRCNVPCNELFQTNLRETVSCSLQIFEEKEGFAEWPEFDRCVSNPTNYLKTCFNEPFFVVDENSAMNQSFIELDSNKAISCSALGYPPPRLVWDVETLIYIADQGGRIVETNSSIEDSDGNWTMRNTLTIAQVQLTDERIYICNASNSAGLAEESYFITVLPYPESTDSGWPIGVTIAGGITLGLLGLLAIPITYAIYRMNKKRNANLLKIYENFKYGSQNTDPATQSTAVIGDQSYLSHLPDAEYETYNKILELPFSKTLEILPHRLELQSSIVLGSGAFGIVFKGVLDEKLVVAVKTVPKGADESKLAALLSEVKIMSYVGKHPNIVQLFGVQIMDLRRGIAFVAVEYCSRGSLEDVLHAKRREISFPRKYISSMYNIPGYIDNANFPKPFTTYQLLTFSHQVSSAMEFLASKNIIHGDLAARNVLLDANFVAKISDFGLSRQIYDNYKKYVFAAKETALPWRSLAIETLKHLKFSTESDIWAFGVFLYEVFSLAELPYSAGISWGPEFVNYLERGFRLEKPEFATQEIYQLMRQCWEAEPSNRIKFQQLSIKLLCFIEGEYKKCQ